MGNIEKWKVYIAIAGLSLNLRELCHVVMTKHYLRYFFYKYHSAISYLF